MENLHFKNIEKKTNNTCDKIKNKDNDFLQLPKNSLITIKKKSPNKGAKFSPKTKLKTIKEKDEKSFDDDNINITLFNPRHSSSSDSGNNIKDKKYKKISKITEKILKLKNETKNIKAYLFGKNKYLLIPLESKDTVNIFIKKVIRTIIEKKICKLKYLNSEYYQIKLIDDEDDEENLEENLDELLTLSGNAILKNMKFISLVFLGIYNEKISISKSNIEDDNYIISVFYKNINGENNEIIKLKSTQTLKDILIYFFDKDLLVYKNMDLYYFVKRDEENDINNAINLELEIKYLSKFSELNLYYKEFLDIPESINTYNISMNMIKLANLSKKQEITNNDKIKKETDIFENSINNKNILIDCKIFNIYELKDSYHKEEIKLYINKNYLLIKKLYNGEKNIKININVIKQCNNSGLAGFYIEIKNNKNDDLNNTKKIYFETGTNDLRNQIVSNINILIKRKKS